MADNQTPKDESKAKEGQQSGPTPAPTPVSQFKFDFSELGNLDLEPFDVKPFESELNRLPSASQIIPQSDFSISSNIQSGVNPQPGLPIEYQNHYQMASINDLDQVDYESAYQQMFRFKYIDHIGEGSCAHVYEAVDGSGDMHFAIKVFKLYMNMFEFSADIVPHEWEFLETMKANPHKNVTTILFSFTTVNCDRYYIVYELAPLGDLFEALKYYSTIDPVTEEEVWLPLKPYVCRHLICGIAEGVQHLLTIGLVHADIKLENILLFWNRPQRDYGTNKYLQMTPKLTDFSNAIVFDVNKPEESVFRNDPLCTVYSAAPETYFNPKKDNPREAEKYDARIADVFSVGVCLLSMLLGAQPFNPALKPVLSNYDFARLGRQMKRDRGFIERLVRPFDYELREVLLKLLEANPEKRITINEFLSDKWFKKNIHPQEFEDLPNTSIWKQYKRGPNRRKRSKLKST